MSEGELWSEVILQQIRDARLELACWPVPARYCEEAANARIYLTSHSEDLAMVCALAGLDMEALVEVMQRKVASVPPLCSPETLQPRQKRGQTFTHAGKSLTVPEWAKATGLSQATTYGRLRRGWPMGEG